MGGPNMAKHKYGKDDAWGLREAATWIVSRCDKCVAMVAQSRHRRDVRHPVSGEIIYTDPPGPPIALSWLLHLSRKGCNHGRRKRALRHGPLGVMVDLLKKARTNNRLQFSAMRQDGVLVPYNARAAAAYIPPKDTEKAALDTAQDRMATLGAFLRDINRKDIEALSEEESFTLEKRRRGKLARPIGYTAIRFDASDVKAVWPARGRKPKRKVSEKKTGGRPKANDAAAVARVVERLNANQAPSAWRACLAEAEEFPVPHIVPTNYARRLLRKVPGSYKQ